jgi:hypothetical protein
VFTANLGNRGRAHPKRSERYRAVLSGGTNFLYQGAISPAKPSVLTHVRLCILKQLQVINRVVAPIAILVVDNLARTKKAANMALHHNTMLLDRAEVVFRMGRAPLKHITSLQNGRGCILIAARIVV